LLTATWTIVILNILDLASPRFGGIRSSAEVYRWTQDGFGSNKTSSDPAGSGTSTESIQGAKRLV